jgi:hypothetical protein
MLSEYKKKNKSHVKSGSTNNNNRSEQSSQTSNPGTTGVAFVQKAEVRVVPGTDGHTCATTTCWCCQSLGHFVDHCPTAGTGDNAPGNTGDGHTQLGACLHAQSLGIKCKWLLLDTGSTMRGVSNPSLVSDVKHCSQDDSIWVHFNSGFMDFTQQGHMQLFDFPVFRQQIYCQHYYSQGHDGTVLHDYGFIV